MTVEALGLHARVLQTKPVHQSMNEQSVAGMRETEDEIMPEGRDGLRLMILRAVLKEVFGLAGEMPKVDENRETASHTSRMRFSMKQAFSFSIQAELNNDQGEVRRVRIEVNLSFSMNLEVSLQQQEEEMTDPLVIQLGDVPLELAEERYRFDLDLDGLLDDLPTLANGAAYLVLDRNGNGRIDDGRELFGPQQGNGFVELAALDDNADGRIDAADSRFNELRLWQPGKPLLSLGDAGIDALSLQRAVVDRRLHQAGRLMGLIREQSELVGVAGRLLEVDLRV